MDVSQEQIWEKAQKEYARNIQSRLRGMDAGKIDDLNKAGTWSIKASDFHVRGGMTLDKAVSDVKANAASLPAAERQALIAALSEAMGDDETSADAETSTSTNG